MTATKKRKAINIWPGGGKVIKELKILRVLSKVDEEIMPTFDENKSIEQYKQRVSDLETRLREINKITRILTQQVSEFLTPQSSIIETAQTLKLMLDSLSTQDAIIYITREFTPNRLDQLDKDSLGVANAIRYTLQDFCTHNGLALIYDAWYARR